MSARYLLDTTVVSIIGPGRTSIPAALAEWVLANQLRLHLSTVSAYEIQQGAEKLRRSNEGAARAERISEWLDTLLTDFEDRVLPVDVAVARKAGAISDAAFARGRHPGMADVLIAATAQTHDLIVLTHNIRHFEPLGIDVIDPLASLPD